MIEYQEVIQKIKERDFLFRDKEGNTLLHALANAEETQFVPIEPVIALLSKYPDMADVQNKFGQTPGDVMDGCQLHSRVANRPFRRLLYEYSTVSREREKLEKSVYMTFIEHLDENQSENYRIIPSDEAGSILKRPTLLLFSGRGNYALPLIKGFGRLMRKTLGIHQQKIDDFQVVSVRYPGTQRDLCNDFLISKQPIEQQQMHPDSPLLYIQHFVERYLRPLYLTSDGRKLPTKTVLKNMRLINMIGYSYGSSVIQGLSERMRKDMAENGFKKAEIDKIQKQIVAFHFGAAINRYHYQSGFKNFHLLNTQDDVVGLDMMEMVPAYDKSKILIQTHLKKDKDQTVMLVNTLENNMDNAPHHINTYCNPVNEAQKVALLWMKAILFNGLANSVQNKRSDTFIPLPENMEQIPNGFVRRQKIAVGSGVSSALYHRKLTDAVERKRV